MVFSSPTLACKQNFPVYNIEWLRSTTKAWEAPIRSTTLEILQVTCGADYRLTGKMTRTKRFILHWTDMDIQRQGGCCSPNCLLGTSTTELLSKTQLAIPSCEWRWRLSFILFELSPVVCCSLKEFVINLLIRIWPVQVLLLYPRNRCVQYTTTYL